MVRDADKRQPDPLLNRFQLPLHFLAQLLIQRAERFVQQHDGRTVDERPGQRHTLLLAAGQLRRHTRLLARQLHHAQRRVDARADFRAGDTAHFEAERDVAEDRQMGKQRVLLEDEVDRPEIGRDIQHRPPVDQNIALIGMLETGDESQRRGLAGSAGTEDGKELAVPDAERQGFHRRRGAVALDHLPQLDGWVSLHYS